MIARDLKTIIQGRLKNFPAVAIFGARQTGKTTLAQTLSSLYFDLELDEEKLRLDLLWSEIIHSDHPIILDEAQNFPEIFPRIRSAIDKDRKRNGRFVILGSVSPSLTKDVADFLTGRIAICELAPFCLTEITARPDDLWLMGGYPDGGILRKTQFRVWQQSYLDLLAMRDLPKWGLPARPQVTQRLFKMLAAVHGNIWNASQIGKSLGLNYHTVNSYLDYLEQVYLIRKLSPYFVNIKKRLVKSPKLYWRDSGLLHSLLNIGSFEELLQHPGVGFSWEGWVIEQILIFLNNHDILFDEPYFFKTNDGYELDLVLILKGKIWAIEIKLTSHVKKEDLDRLNKAADLIGAHNRVLISRTPDTIASGNIYSTNLSDFLALLKEA